MQLFQFQKGITPTKVKISKAQSFLKTSSNNVLTLFVLATLGLQALLFLQTTFNTIWIAKLARRPAPTLVELQDGRSIQVGVIGSQERSALAIQNFTSQIATMLFSTVGTLDSDSKTPKNSLPTKLDPGVVLQGRAFRGNNKVTTAAWSASFALSEEFRKTFLYELADITPLGVFRGTTQTVLVISYLSEPELIETGKWKLNMIANLYTFEQGQKLGEAIPINKTIYLKAVYVSPQALLENASNIQRVIYKAREAGLEIYRFGDLTTSPQPSPKK